MDHIKCAGADAAKVFQTIQVGLKVTADWIEADWSSGGTNGSDFIAMVIVRNQGDPRLLSNDLSCQMIDSVARRKKRCLDWSAHRKRQSSHALRVGDA